MRRRGTLVLVVACVMSACTGASRPSDVATSGSHSRPAASSALPKPLRDGLIVFTRHRPGPDKYLPDAALYVTTSSGRSVRQLTTPSGDIHAVAATPNGRRIAYSAETYGYRGHWRVTGDVVHVMSADGSHNRVVYHCPSSTCWNLEWSPVGDRLLINGTTVLEPDGHLTQLCATGCTDRQMPSDATWSPDGKQLAVVMPLTLQLPEGTSTLSAIGTADSDGNHLHLITDRRCSARSQSQCTYDNAPAWSPDGSQIAFTRLQPTFLRLDQSMGLNPGGRTSLVMVHPDGSDTSEIHSCGDNCRVSSIQWAPESERALFVTGQATYTGMTTASQVGVADVATRTGDTLSVKTHISPFDEHWLAPAVAWAPNQKALTMVAHTPGHPAGLYLLNVRGTRLTRPSLIRRGAHPPLIWLPAVGS